MAAGYEQLLAWARVGGGASRAVLGDRGHPALRPGPGPAPGRGGEQVTEIDGTRRVGKRRTGKSDAIDAVRAARELLARPHRARCVPTVTARRCGC